MAVLISWNLAPLIIIVIFIIVIICNVIVIVIVIVVIIIIIIIIITNTIIIIIIIFSPLSFQKHVPTRRHHHTVQLGHKEEYVEGSEPYRPPGMEARFQAMQSVMKNNHET